MPEEEVTDGLILECFTEKELAQLAVKVGLKLEHLHKLKKIHQQLLITDKNKGSHDQWLPSNG